MSTRVSFWSDLLLGTKIDELNGVAVYFNGGINESHGRNVSAKGYNLGIKYQCVEFVKRYYFTRFNHEMPDAYGHAVSFFDPEVADGDLNKKRGLLQFVNGSSIAPSVDDILIFGPTILNPYGHVAIIAEVNPYALIIVQQNAGPIASSREAIPIVHRGAGFYIANSRVLGWLRLPK